MSLMGMLSSERVSPAEDKTSLPFPTPIKGTLVPTLFRLKIIIRASMYRHGTKGVNLFLASSEVLVWHL
nr:hypothetical protein CFP56_49246 [Quercus suber]